MINDAMIGTGLIIFLIILLIPLVSAFVISLIKSVNPRKALNVVVGGIMVCVIILILLGDMEIHTALAFMREPISISISLTGLLLYLANIVALTLVIYSSNKQVLSRFQAVLILLTLTFGFLALMSGQFMIRYIALDVVGLLVSASVITSFSKSAPFQDFILIFQVLRFGDLALLASILLINHQAGTLDIADMIHFAAEMSPEPRVWVFGGFLLAILIKLGVWPFGIWLGRARRSAPRESFWISGFMMPTLGMYLLYRIAPIIHASQLFQIITFSIALGFGVLLFLVSQFGLVGHHRFYHMGSLYGCLALIAISIPGVQWIGYYFTGLILYRLLLALQTESAQTVMDWIILFFPALISLLFLLGNSTNLSISWTIVWIVLIGAAVIWDWGRFSKNLIKHGSVYPRTDQQLDGPFVGDKLIATARWLNQKLEINLFSEGILKFSNSFVGFAQWLHKTFEVNFFSRGITRLSRLFTSAADWLQDRVEQGLENLWTWLGQNLKKFSDVALFTMEIKSPEKTDKLVDSTIQSIREYDQDERKHVLRWDLAVIPLFLIIILFFLFIF